MHWAEQKAEQIKQEDQEEASQRDYEVMASRNVDAKLPKLWESVNDEVAHAVVAFNSRFTNRTKHLEFFPGIPLVQDGFRVRKSNYPAVTVDVVLDRKARQIDILTTLTHGSGSEPILDVRPSLEFVYESGDVYIKHGMTLFTVEDAAKHIFDFATGPF